MRSAALLARLGLRRGQLLVGRLRALACAFGRGVRLGIALLQLRERVMRLDLRGLRLDLRGLLLEPRELGRIVVDNLGSVGHGNARGGEGEDQCGEQFVDSHARCLVLTACHSATTRFLACHRPLVNLCSQAFCERTFTIAHFSIGVYRPFPMTNATDDEIQAIRARAYNDIAREIARSGVRLTHDQAAEADGVNLGDKDQRRASCNVLAWLSERLGLHVSETDTGYDCTPA